MTRETTVDMPDSGLSASSSISAGSGPQHSHIDGEAWVPSQNSKSEWIMVDFGSPQVIVGLSTKGHKANLQWVKAYSLLYSMNGQDFSYYSENGRPKVNFSFNCNVMKLDLMNDFVKQSFQLQ